MLMGQAFLCLPVVKARRRNGKKVRRCKGVKVQSVKEAKGWKLFNSALNYSRVFQRNLGPLVTPLRAE